MEFAFRPLRKGHWSSGDDVSEQGGEVFCRAKTPISEQEYSDASSASIGKIENCILLLLLKKKKTLLERRSVAGW